MRLDFVVIIGIVIEKKRFFFVVEKSRVIRFYIIPTLNDEKKTAQNKNCVSYLTHFFFAR